MFDQLKDKLRIDNRKWQSYIGCFQRMEVPAKTILLKEGEISKKVFLIEKGCIRVWFNNNGKDVTFQFFFENSPVSSIESFRKKISSLVTLETVEPCILWYIHKKDMDQILQELTEIPAVRELLMEAIFQRTFDYMKHFFSSIKDSPQQRYLNLISENPQIIKRVPQHYIASFLGISGVHLSRIKGQLAKKK